MVGRHHRLNGHEFEQTLGDSEGQGSLACCIPWGRKESDTTEGLNNNSVTIGNIHQRNRPDDSQWSLENATNVKESDPMGCFSDLLGQVLPVCGYNSVVYLEGGQFGELLGFPANIDTVLQHL